MGLGGIDAMKAVSTGISSVEFGGVKNSIESIHEVQDHGFGGKKVETGGGSVGTFSEMLKNSISEVNENQLHADTAIKEFVAGRNKNIHETLLAIEKADTSLKLMMQVRNKVLDAYREIMRMQV
jgi:flagellar hook-basal body complex protein FliE